MVFVDAVVAMVFNLQAEPNQLLQQPGHATDGFARRTVYSRVSRLLSVFVRQQGGRTR